MVLHQGRAEPGNVSGFPAVNSLLANEEVCFQGTNFCDFLLEWSCSREKQEEFRRWNISKSEKH